jgi:hypothetical protein
VERRLPSMVDKAVAEARARTSATIIPLPPDEADGRRGHWCPD